MSRARRTGEHCRDDAAPNGAMRRLVATFFLAAMAVVGAVWACPAADAHALLASSDPADGASVDAPPSQILLTFTEAPDPALAVVRILDAQGRAVDAGKPDAVPGAPTQLRVPVSRLAQGNTYTLTWRATSAADGHTTAGSIAFGVGVPAVPAADIQAAAPVRSPSPTATGIAGRALLYAGVALLVGGAAVGLFVARDGSAIPFLPVAAGWVVATVGVALTAVDQSSVARVSIG